MQITRLRTLTLSKENSMIKFHSRLRHLWRAFVATILSLAFAAPALAQTYTAIDVPGYPYTHAFGMNDFGSIVGDCDFADGYVSAYVLRRGNFTIIDAPGAVATSAWDINNLGVIVGDYYGEDYLYHGFLYVDGKLTTIDFPGAVHTSAQGIDDFGRIVGIFIDDTDTWRGFILVGDKFRVIEAPNAQITTAVGITGPDIVGDMEINGVSTGYVLRKGRFTPIAYPGANFTTANRINYSGEIVGTWAEDPDAQVGHAYLLTQRRVAVY